MDMALNKQVDLEDRLSSIRLLGGSDSARGVSETHACEALVNIIYDKDDAAEARTTAVHSLSNISKRKVFPFFLQFIEGNDLPQYVIDAAIDSVYKLGDSRALFPLVEKYTSLDHTNDAQRNMGYRILLALRETADPRAADWLKELKKTGQRTGIYAGEAHQACADNEEFIYTFAGNNQLYLKSKEQLVGKFITTPDDLQNEKVKEDLQNECVNGVCYATYVIIPEKESNPFAGGQLVIGPRRTEHVFVAGGADVLAAGEIGFSSDNVTYLDNHSGGYLPAVSSFGWVKKAIEKAGLRTDLKKFSMEFPAEGYCSPEFLKTYKN